MAKNSFNKYTTQTYLQMYLNKKNEIEYEKKTTSNPIKVCFIIAEN